MRGRRPGRIAYAVADLAHGGTPVRPAPVPPLTYTAADRAHLARLLVGLRARTHAAHTAPTWADLVVALGDGRWRDLTGWPPADAVGLWIADGGEV